MDKWMNVAGRAGTGAAIAGVSMTYYALMRRNAEIERQSQTQEVVSPESEIEAALEASKENRSKTDDDDEDSKTKSMTKSLFDEKDRANANSYEENIRNISNMLDLAEASEFDADSLTDSECILSDELPWFTQCSKSMAELLEDKLNGNITVEPPDESKAVAETTLAAPIHRNDEDLIALSNSSSNTSVLQDGNDDSSTTLESCPEPLEPPPVLKLTSSGRVDQKSSDVKESMSNEPDSILLEYIPPDSWIAWPLKFFPARYSSYVLAAIAVIFWIVCALVTYCTLKFCYYSMGWKQSPSATEKPVSPITEAELDVTNVEDYEYSLATSQWHW